MKRIRLLLVAGLANFASVLCDADAQWQPDQSAMMASMMPAGDMSWSGQQQQVAGQQGSGQCGVQVDECCGMAHEGCCMGGQQCYTYYETVCENVQTQRCKPKFKQVCVNEVLPDCKIEKKRATQTIHEEVCRPVPKKECFSWQRPVCNMIPASVEAEVSWQNQKLVPKLEGAANKSECVEVSKCKYEDIETIKTENVPKEKCEDVPDSKYECKRVPIQKTKVIQDVTYEIRYEQQCSQVNQPRCETSPCQSNGCTNGGSVCSQQDYQPQTVCAEGLMTGESSNCQQVNMPVCYGDLGSCSSYDQQCCYNQPTQVCGQVQRRVPVTRNRTVSYYDWEEKCETYEFTRKDCKTEYETVNKTVTTQKCHQYFDTVCANYTVPQYEVKLEDKSEKVSFVSRKCQWTNMTEQFCHTFPNADYKCSKRPAQRDYILNKVVCKEQKEVKFCMNIPEGECENVPDQKCKVVPRQICQQGCSTSNMCNQCDNFRNQGGFSSCSSGTCPNYFPEDPIIAGIGGGNSGFNPGQQQGGSGFNPGQVQGGSGYNPGAGGYYPGGQGGSGYNPGYPDNTGNWGYNPGQNGDLVEVGDEWLTNGTNWRPGNDWYSPQDPYRPLYPPAYGGYKPLNPGGDSGFNPGQYAPLSPDGGNSGYNPGQYAPLTPDGNSGFNPGQYSPLTPPDQGWGQGGGYNPGGGGGWGTGGGFNQGTSRVADEVQPLSGNEALQDDEDTLDEESIVL